MVLSRVPRQGGRDGWSRAVTASHAPGLHNATLSWDSGLFVAPSAWK